MGRKLTAQAAGQTMDLTSALTGVSKTVQASGSFQVKLHCKMKS